MNFFFTFFFLFTISCSAMASNFNKVLVIVFENTVFENAIKQPFLASLTKEGALLTNFKAVINPSQGNYIAMIAGTSYNIRHDNPIGINDRHLGDLLEEAGKDWKVYAEDYPGSCFLGATSGNYARKHIPFLSFQNVQKNPKRCSKIVEGKDFFNDFNTSKLKDFSMYIPNLKNDAHDTGIAYADKWFKNTFEPILRSPLLPRDLLVVITFDEGNILNNHIYTLLLGANAIHGIQSKTPYNFYSLLRTYEDNLGLGSLNKYDLSANPINDIWHH